MKWEFHRQNQEDKEIWETRKLIFTKRNVGLWHGGTREEKT